MTSTWTANGLNQLAAQTAPAGSTAAYSYDAEGNLLADGRRTYEWDAENRLVAVNYGGGKRVEWTYDAYSRRVKQEDITAGGVHSTRDLIWEGLNLIESRASQGGTAGEVRKYYGNGEERVVSGVTTRLSYTTDHLGSIREMVDGTGVVRARYDYDPYGNRTKVSGTLDSDFGYTGHYTHEASGIVLAPYRGYDPTTGRWLSRDPIEEEGGINLYGYVGNGPTQGTDPSGLIGEDLINLAIQARLVASAKAGVSCPGLGYRTAQEAAFMGLKYIGKQKIEWGGVVIPSPYNPGTYMFTAPISGTNSSTGANIPSNWPANKSLPAYFHNHPANTGYSDRTVPNSFSMRDETTCSGALKDLGIPAADAMYVSVPGNTFNAPNSKNYKAGDILRYMPSQSPSVTHFNGVSAY